MAKRQLSLWIEKSGADSAGSPRPFRLTLLESYRA